MVTGIICEYNPFHFGHKKQLSAIRADDPDGVIVCLMSGNFVQRGAPAIIDKLLRAKAAVLCGADLVLEIPVTVTLQSAEGFAAGGVSILSQFCDRLCFGAENADPHSLMSTAEALLSKTFSPVLRSHLDRGLSFPAARQAALDALGFDGSLVAAPNNILAVEYCKAIISQHSPMAPMPICREGDYHCQEADAQNPSATSLRNLMLTGSAWQDYVPTEVACCFSGAALHSMRAGERAVLYRLRTMDDEQFESLPYSSEGLWRKLMHASRQNATLEEILNAVKSKRYTRSRLDRMVMCAALGISQEILNSPVPYTRVLALNSRGRDIIKKARTKSSFPNIGERLDHPYQALEDRCTDLYGLFCESFTEPAGTEKSYRIFCL